MSNNEPESQSLSLQVQETARWTKEPSASCKEGLLEPGGQQGRRSPQFSRAHPPAANAKGDLCVVEQHSGVWSPAVSAVVWSLPQLYLKVVYSTLLGLLLSILAPLLASGEFPQEPVDRWSFRLYRQSCSDHMCRYLRCVSLPAVSVLT